MQHLLKWLLIVGSALIFIASDSLSANWGKTGHRLSFILVLLLAPLGYLMFGLLNKKISLGASSGLVNIMMVLGGVLVGVLWFQEMLTLRQGIGVGLGIVAILLLS